MIRRSPIHRRSYIRCSTKYIRRGVRPARERKTSLGAAKRTLWSYFAAYVKNRDGNQCFTCPAIVSGVYLHAGHMFSRRHSATIYDPKNCHSQCSACNRGRRGNTPEYVARFINKYGVREFERLANKAREFRQWTLPEVRELIAALRRSGADFEILYAEKYGL